MVRIDCERDSQVLGARVVRDGQRAKGGPQVMTQLSVGLEQQVVLDLFEDRLVHRIVHQHLGGCDSHSHRLLGIPQQSNQGVQNLTNLKIDLAKFLNFN